MPDGTENRNRDEVPDPEWEASELVVDVTEESEDFVLLRNTLPVWSPDGLPVPPSFHFPPARLHPDTWKDLWNASVRMLGGGRGYAALLQLRDRLEEQSAHLSHVASAMIDQHSQAQELLCLVADGGPGALLERGGDVAPLISEVLRRYAKHGDTEGLKERICQFLLDDDLFAEREFYADLAYYRFGIVERVLLEFEFCGRVPLYATEGLVVQPGDDASDPTPRERPARRALSSSAHAGSDSAEWRDLVEWVDRHEVEQLWAFIDVARHVLLHDGAVKSMSAVLKQVDDDLGTRPDIEWRSGRARKYAKLCGAYRSSGKEPGAADESDHRTSFDHMKDRVLALHKQGLDAGKLPLVDLD